MSDQDLATRLEQTFEYTAVWLLEKLEFGEKLTEQEAKDADLYFSLADTVRHIPAPLMQDTTELAAKHPDAFEQALSVLLLSEFRPSTATAFVEKLCGDMLKRQRADG